MAVRIEQVRAEDVYPGDIERHVSGQGRLMPWRRVAKIRPGLADPFIHFEYENGDITGGSVRKLDLVEIQRCDTLAVTVP